LKTLIRNARCVLPSGIEKTDILVDGNVIAHVGVPAGSRADETIDAGGMVLMPGVIDDQVHFREPGATHKEDMHTGSQACAKGGITTFLEMPNTNPETITQTRLTEKLELAAGKCVVNFGFYIGATAGNLEELKTAMRTPGIKIFVGSSTGNLLVDGQEVLERIFAETNLTICAHCEDESTIRTNRAALGEQLEMADHSRIRDHQAALVATRRIAGLAHRHQRRFHVLHVSTAEEVDFLRTNHRELVTAEACLHHLYFTTDDYARLGSRVQMNPSVKDRKDIEALWKGLDDGTIQVIATDHAPHTLEEKQQPYPESPSGIPAVENSLALMLDAVNRGRLKLEQVVDRMCAAPARVWDIVNKGRIEEGYDADLALVDLERKQTVLDDNQVSKSGWSPWHGVELTGWPVRTWVMGRTVFADGRVDPAMRGREAMFDHERGGYFSTHS
jgi:dihydroorotase